MENNLEPAAPVDVSRRPKFVRWALMLGIVIILNVFFSVIVSLAFPTPAYESYCPQRSVVPTDAVSCDAIGGVWTNYSATPAPAGMTAPTGYCDLYAKCQQPFQAAVDANALSSFIAMIVLGILAIVAGLLPIGSSIVSSGLSYGGAAALVIGSILYWGTAGNWLRLLISAVGLLALLYIGWKRFRD